VKRSSYTEAIQFLYSLRFFGTKLGLENTFRLAALFGNPHHRLRFIHVAGTNGKGSTCAMLESIYRAAGLRVGLFTSPHLVSFRERMQVNRKLIEEQEVVRQVAELQRAVRADSADMHPTFFEVVTVMALRYFVEQQCDLVIWETGLGGRLDSTNIVTPLASLITNIQFDHEKWLGSTLAQIAAEKAGIIKPGIPALTAADAPEALQVIQQIAARHCAPLTRVTASDTQQPPLSNLELPLEGEHQRLNAALAVAAVRALQNIIPVSDVCIRRGLSRVAWSGRLQRHSTPDGRCILLDGAHNPAGAETLRRALASGYPGQKPTLILGILRDKDWAGMCRILAPLACRSLLAPVHSDRTAQPAELLTACLAIEPATEVVACSSLAEALRLAESEPFVVVTGSLHFVGEAMEELGLLPASKGERALNEWDASGRVTESAVRVA
jgi:dihydrofolate synthase/folylpolyglutamate synthase